MTQLRIGAPVGPLLLVLAAAQAVVAVLFFSRAPVVIDMWPLPATGEMSLNLIAALLAAASASTAWAVLWGEPASLVGIALDYIVIFVPLLAFALVLDPALGGGVSTLAFASFGGLLAGSWMLRWSWGREPIDPRPTPAIVRGAFVVFVVALVLVGGSLVAGVSGILPWSVSRELSTVAGIMFLGAASYFAYGVVRPRWTNAGGQLAGFLAYDLVLIVPLLTRPASIYSGWGVNMWAYLAVIIGSGLLAAWYLFVAPDTRLIRPRPAAPTTPVAPGP